VNTNIINKKKEEVIKEKSITTIAIVRFIFFFLASIL